MPTPSLKAAESSDEPIWLRAAGAELLRPSSGSLLLSAEPPQTPASEAAATAEAPAAEPDGDSPGSWLDGLGRAKERFVDGVDHFLETHLHIDVVKQKYTRYQVRLQLRLLSPPLAPPLASSRLLSPRHLNHPLLSSASGASAQMRVIVFSTTGIPRSDLFFTVCKTGLESAD